MATVILKGSERTTLPGARVIGPADPAERLEVSVLVRRRSLQTLQTRVAALASGIRPAQTLSREEFATQHGAEAVDLAAVRAFALANNLVLVQQDAARRTIVLSGTVAQFSSAFSVQLKQFAHAGGTYRGRAGTIQLPAELDGALRTAAPKGTRLLQRRFLTLRFKWRLPTASLAAREQGSASRSSSSAADFVQQT